MTYSLFPRILAALVVLLPLSGCATELALDPPATPPPVTDPPAVDPEPPLQPGIWLGPELSLDEPVSLERTDQHIGNVALAYDGDVFLAAWLKDGQVRATRLSAAGDVLDPGGMVLAGGDERCFDCVQGPEVAVAGHDGQFFVAWSGRERRGDAWDVRYGRVRGADGARLDPVGGVPVARSVRHEIQPSVSVGELGGRSYWTVAFQRMDATGELASQIEIELVDFRTPSISPLIADVPSVGLDGTQPSIVVVDPAVVVAWKEGEGVECEGLHVAQLFGEETIHTTLRDRSTASHCGAPVTAAIPGGFMVAWREGSTVRGSLFDLGSQTPRNAEPHTLLDLVGYPTRPKLSVGDEIVIVADAGGLLPGRRAIRIGRFSLQGDPLTEARTIDGVEAPAVVLGADRYLVAWNDRRVGLDGVLLDPTDGSTVSVSAPWGQPQNDEVGPASAFDGETILVAWSDSRGARDPAARRSVDATGVYGVRLLPDGTRLDSTAFPIGVDPHGVRDVAVAAGDDGFVVVWASEPNADDGDTSEIRAARVGADGTVGAAMPIAHADAFPPVLRPAIAPVPGGYLVAWERGTDHNATSMRSVQAAWLGSDLRPRSDVLEVSTSTERAGWPAVAADGERVFIGYAGCDDPESICFNPLTPRCGSDIRGVVVDEAGLRYEVDLATADHCELEPTVASFDGRFFVIWQDAGDLDTTFTDLWGVRVEADLSVGEPEPVVSIPAVDGNARLAADELGYVVAWSNYGDLRLTRAGLEGHDPIDEGLLVAPQTVEIGARPGDSYRIGLQAPAQLALTPLGRGQLFVAYDRPDPELALQRVRARFVTHVPDRDPI